VTVRRLASGLVVLLLLLAGAGVAAWRWARAELLEPLPFGAPGDERIVEIRPGSSSRRIIAELERLGVVRHADLVRLYHSRVLGDPPLQAGEYRFVSPVAAVEVLRVLREGEVVTRPVTVVEGLTYLEAADAIAAAGFAEAAALRAQFEDPRRIADLDPAARNLEGYLFPDTYRFARSADASAITDALVARFREVWLEAVVPRRAAGDERPAREVVLLASLVEKEASRDDERPLVASVYTNRLRRGIGLYADPTLIYGLKLAGRWDGNLRRSDLEADGEWNTYRRPGLPPGPICSPGRASLAAAARPAETDLLYFVSRNDGSHVFSRTLAEHNHNVETWQREYFRKRRAQK